MPWATCGLLAGCEGPQSALSAAGAESTEVAQLFWWMAAGAAIIWVLVIGLAVFALRARPERYSDAALRNLIIGGGTLFPTVVLAVLLAYGLYLMPNRQVDGHGLVIEVSGEQWWWRVRYRPQDGRTVESANEIRLPVGQRVEFLLSSPDVIHSLWIPSLGGKLDMIPGRVTRMVLEPTRTGVFRGACAEYCGASHALMAFKVVVMEQPAFDAWLRGQAAPAEAPADDAERRGHRLFLANGCGGCHGIRGTPARGVIGPDLTHVGSRLSLGAGILPNTPEALQRWMAHTDAVKPSVRMPAFGMLPPADLKAMAAYLSSLQ